MKKQKENSREGITWSEMGKQNVQAEKVYYQHLWTQGFYLLWLWMMRHEEILKYKSSIPDGPVRKKKQFSFNPVLLKSH